MTSPALLLLAAALAASAPAAPDAGPPAAPAVAPAPAGAAAAAFRARCKTMGRTKLGAPGVIAGGRGELFLARHLAGIGSGRFWGEDAAKTEKGRAVDPLAAIVDFKKQLQARGVELLVVPIPPKALVYPELLPGVGTTLPEPPARLDTVESEFLAALRQNGVAVLDLLPALLERRGGPSDYCKTDHHLNGRGQALVARLIAESVAGQPWLAPAREGAPEWRTQWRDTRIEGALAWMQATGTKVAPEVVALRYVTDPRTGRPPAEDPGAPVLLMGDSCVLVFHAGANEAVPTASMHTAGAGLMEQLVAELKVPVDVAGTLLDGVDAPRLTVRNRQKARAGYLAGKKLVVWVFFEDALTQIRDGWRQIPIP